MCLKKLLSWPKITQAHQISIFKLKNPPHVAKKSDTLRQSQWTPLLLLFKIKYRNFTNLWYAGELHLGASTNLWYAGELDLGASTNLWYAGELDLCASCVLTSDMQVSWTWVPAVY